MGNYIHIVDCILQNDKNGGEGAGERGGGCYVNPLSPRHHIQFEIVRKLSPISHKNE